MSRPTKILNDLRVGPAAHGDWPQIVALRKAYFERFSRPYQERPPDTRWYAVKYYSRVVGVFSIQDFPEYDQRFVLDFMRSDDVAGTVAMKAMIDFIEQDAVACGLSSVCGTYDPRNTQIGPAFLKHGYSPVGILVQRKLT
jgi:hypothetical protein